MFWLRNKKNNFQIRTVIWRSQTGTEERYRDLKICVVINFCRWYWITHVVVPKYTDRLKKVRAIKVINTLSAPTCELVDEYSNSPVSDVQAENFYFQVKFINCYLREIITFTKKIDIRDWGQSSRSAIQWFHIKHYLDYQNTKFQPYTFWVQKNVCFCTIRDFGSPTN